VIFEVWPLFGMVATALLMRERFESLTKRSFLLGLVALLGLGLVVWSGQGHDDGPTAYPNATLGILAATGAAIAMAISVATHVKARTIIGALPGMRDAAVVTNVLTKAVSAGLFFAVLLVWQPWATLTGMGPGLWGFVLFNGIFIVSIGSVAYSESLAVGSRSDVILLWYMTPLLAVIWLRLFGLGEITDTLVLGGLFIISANVLLHARADDGPAYIAVFLTLCLSGTIIHLMPSRPLETFLPNANLVDLISPPLGIFGILTGFVLGRQFTRQEGQEDMLLRIAPCLSPQESVHLEAALSAGRQNRIDVHYRRLYETAHQRDPALGAALKALRVKLNRAVSHGELIVLWALSLMTSLSVLFFRPAGVIGDMIVLLTVTSLTYLVMLMTAQGNPGLIATARRTADPLAPPTPSRIWDRRVASLAILLVFLTQVALAFQRDGRFDLF